MSDVTARPRAIGTPMDRIDGAQKVTGTATYAYEWPLDQPVYLYPLQSTIASGRVAGVDSTLAEAEPGVLAVLSHLNAPTLTRPDDPELAVLQSDEVAWRGQFIGAVVAESLETARRAAGLVRVDYESRPPMWCCAPTATTSTPRCTPPPSARAAENSRTARPPTACSGTRTRRWRPRRSWWTPRTPRRCTTTTRWSRTPPWSPGWTVS
ncbi:hypothetical protein SVIO_030110 [Streptomyces violaceusniger]|uniref:Aldehyde oxidase/xanthine dehydrogenase a/b hammerhead domain-containing protein n=1 Tax=Streptomyces violaceusniger TaxID=68280 RepID=A0A4D4L196_STRVO|nr:hypothetical protein SVIO_030110 [Streptomyces violaceusniger]